MIKILLIGAFFSIHLCRGQGGWTWYCGGVEILSSKSCKCGQNFISYDDIEEDLNCCGRDNCYIDDVGNAICPDGVICQADDGITWLCGDIRISKDSPCVCGGQQLSWYPDFYKHNKWCCPSLLGQCIFQTSGSGLCSNASVQVGANAGCDGDICYNREYVSCKTGEQCVDKNKICQGFTICRDGSDVEYCKEDDVCIGTSYDSKDHQKCPGILPSGHVQCFNPEKDIDNEKFDCYSRQDEAFTKEPETVVDFNSLKTCNLGDGLQCGSKCLLNYSWCRSDRSTSCSTFSSDNRILCKNATFWSDLDCNYHQFGGVAHFGHRCKGGLQHCFYPAYQRWDYDTDSKYYKLSCSDFSDQVHVVGSQCIAETYTEEWCRQFCPEDQYWNKYGIGSRIFTNGGLQILRGKDCNICKNVAGWLSEQNSSAILDPHNCQKSCGNPSYNCTACTNPDYRFQCNINKVLHCIHPELLCNGHPDCDQAEDEMLDQPDCIEKLIQLDYISQEATVICPSPIYRDPMKIAAVACNNKIECGGDGRDEHYLCTNSHITLYGTIIAVIILFFMSLILNCCSKDFRNLVVRGINQGSLITLLHNRYKRKEENLKVFENEKIVLPDVLNKEIFHRDHDETDFKNAVNLFILLCKVTDNKEDRIAKNEKLYKLELERHQGNEAETACCIKTTLELSNAKILLEDAFPGCIRTYCPCLESVLNYLDMKHCSYWLLNKAKSIFNIYIDLVKDVIFMYTVFVLVGGFSALYYFPNNLTSVVVFCQFGSITIPLIVTAILNTKEEIKETTSFDFKRKVLKYSIEIFKSPLTPLFLCKQYEDNKAQRKTMILYNKHKEKVLQLFEDGEKLRKKYANFIKVDLGLEVFFQLSGQIIYLLLTITETPTSGGFEELFRKTSDTFLGLSIALSLKTIYFTYFKIVSIEKPHFPTKSKFFLFIWILVSASLRVYTLVLYFTPSFGLFSILAHWKLEQTPFSEQLRQSDKIHLFNTTPFSWSDIDRWNYTDPSNPIPPSYSLFTGYSLAEYFTMFWIILLLHTYINILVKVAVSEHFRKFCSFKNSLEVIVHGIENTNIPTVWKDWDTDVGCVDDHRKRHRKVIIEMVLIMLARNVFHVIMLFPYFYTGYICTFNCFFLY